MVLVTFELEPFPSGPRTRQLGSPEVLQPALPDVPRAALLLVHPLRVGVQLLFLPTESLGS